MKVHPISRRELWYAQVALIVAILLQVVAWAINPELTYGPHSMIVGTELALAVMIGLTAGRRHLHLSHLYRAMSFVLLGLISLANFISFALVARLLIFEAASLSGRETLIAALAIFATNVIIFSLWYWEIDSPGLTGTRWSKHDMDFHFTEQELGHEYREWQPSYVDYLYLSCTNAINFAPADAKPITAQAKVLMGGQALISVFTLALILTRSISILG
ncbi:MAG: hypothetical protein WAQ57_02640 [Candidatus Saccharimonadales bacterium]